jgi:signal transduction histidine kinase
MAATSAADSQTIASQPEADPLAARLLTLALITLVLWLMLADAGTIAESVRLHGLDLLLWAAIVVTVDLFPISLGKIRLTLDLSVLLATALLYPPAVAAGLGLLAALDVREIRKEVAASSAIFNRAQIAISLYLASLTFNALAGPVSVSPSAIGATVAALAVDFVVNVGFVSLFVVLRTRGNLSTARRQFETASPALLLITHLGYGVLAFLLAVISNAMGLWSAALFLVPIVAARQLLIRNEQLRTTTGRLQQRERLLEQLFHGTVAERRDERMRIAGELHDDVLQILSRIQQISATLAKRVGEPLKRVDAEDLSEAATAGMNSLRLVMQDIQRSPIGPGGLVPTLNSLVRAIQLGQSTAIKLRSPQVVQGSEEVLLASYQVAREALMNALTHAKAETIQVHIGQTEWSLVVDVRDDGVGFNPDVVDPSRHFGLSLMKERVALAGGELEVSSFPREGTRVRATFPVRLRR